MTTEQLIAHLAQIVHAQNHGTRFKTFHGCEKELCRLAAEKINQASGAVTGKD